MILIFFKYNVGSSLITGAPDSILKDHEQFCMFEHGKYMF